MLRGGSGHPLNPKNLRHRIYIKKDTAILSFVYKDSKYEKRVYREFELSGAA